MERFVPNPCPAYIKLYYIIDNICITVQCHLLTYSLTLHHRGPLNKKLKGGLPTILSTVQSQEKEVKLRCKKVCNKLGKEGILN